MITNIKRYEGLPFQEYLALDGFSNSTLKNMKDGHLIEKDFSGNRKVMIGKFLDAIVTDGTPDLQGVSIQEKNWCLKAAQKIILKFPYFFNQYTKYQVAYTGVFKKYKLELQLKGLPDIEIHNCIIDLKYTETNIKHIDKLIEFMGYDKQVSLYGELAQKSQRFILVIDKYQNIDLVPVTYDPYPWLIEKLMLHGTANEDLIIK